MFPRYHLTEVPDEDILNKKEKRADDMNKMIKADIYFDGEYYCARCIDFDIFTQGKTLDELTNNL
jgi:hypothetical protein